MADLLNGIPRVDVSSGPTGFRRLISRIPTTRLGAAIHRRLLAPIDVRLMRMTGGHVSSVFGIVPLVVLRTTGARSGTQRDTPVGYFTDGDDVILIASNYGRAEHPGWYYNLLKRPECELLADGVEGRGGRFIAHLTKGADRDRLFALAQRYSPNYIVYAERTMGVREMPVFRLAPKAP
ncbi:MAG TPA: nitroreductase/quinone reductase family protein [Mycobacterium sp.]|nr:nitroreductase/quinone reductase family protein [Mycobacterium sp.]HTX94759.1 nitroreductase/quinone reductase family protein [Mycobacterium sp.]